MIWGGGGGGRNIHTYTGMWREKSTALFLFFYIDQEILKKKFF